MWVITSFKLYVVELYSCRTGFMYWFCRTGIHRLAPIMSLSDSMSNKWSCPPIQSGELILAPRMSSFLFIWVFIDKPIGNSCWRTKNSFPTHCQVYLTRWEYRKSEIVDKFPLQTRQPVEIPTGIRKWWKLNYVFNRVVETIRFDQISCTCQNIVHLAKILILKRCACSIDVKRFKKGS